MASNALWGYLLRKDLPEHESVSQIPPLAPLDKSGTSIRMLVHDTQVNLEKFSGRVDALLNRVDDCKSQVVNANKLLEAERDRVLAEALDIANRFQSELKAHVGMPAQAHALDVLQTSQLSSEKSVQALEKRIDALQGMFQMHITVMKSIQDQQNAILDGILPLLPVLQGVPQHIDQLNVNLTNMVSNAVSNLTNRIDEIKTVIKSFESTYAQQTHLLRSATVITSVSPSKRSNSTMQELSDSANHVDASPSIGRVQEPHARRSKKLRLDEGMVNAILPQPRQQLIQFPDTNVPIMHKNVSQPPTIQQIPKTANRPLPGLVSLSKSPSFEMLEPDAYPHEECNVSHIRDRPLTGTTYSDGRNPSAPTSTRHVVYAATSGRQSTATTSITGDLLLNPIVPGSPGCSTVAISKNMIVENITHSKSMGMLSITSSPLSPLSSPSQSRPLSIDQSGLPAPEPRALTRSRSQVHEVEMRSHLRSHLDSARQKHSTTGPKFPASPNPCASSSPPKSMSLRDRRAQISVLGRTRTRRIIPLLPSSDEEH